MIYYPLILNVSGCYTVNSPQFTQMKDFRWKVYSLQNTLKASVSVILLRTQSNYSQDKLFNTGKTFLPFHTQMLLSWCHNDACDEITFILLHYNNLQSHESIFFTVFFFCCCKNVYLLLFMEKVLDASALWVFSHSHCTPVSHYIQLWIS